MVPRLQDASRPSQDAASPRPETDAASPRPEMDAAPPRPEMDAASPRPKMDAASPRPKMDAASPRPGLEVSDGAIGCVLGYKVPSPINAYAAFNELEMEIVDSRMQAGAPAGLVPSQKRDATEDPMEAVRVSNIRVEVAARRARARTLVHSASGANMVEDCMQAADAHTSNS